MARKNLDARFLVYVEVAIFGLWEGSLSVLIARPTHSRYGGRFTLPYQLLSEGQTSEQGAQTLLSSLTNARFAGPIHVGSVTNRGFEELSVSIVEMFCVSEVSHPKIEGFDEVRWYRLASHAPLTDHHSILLRSARRRLQDEVYRTVVAPRKDVLDQRKQALEIAKGFSLVAALLPDEFSLADFQRAVEGILPELVLDSSNFRKAILSTGLLSETGSTVLQGRHRPARLFSLMKG